MPDRPFSMVPVETHIGSSFPCCGDTRDRALREPVLSYSRPAVLRSIPVDAVAKETLRIDRVEAELLAQFLAQLADVAFDDILFDVLVEDAVNRVGISATWIPGAPRLATRYSRMRRSRRGSAKTSPLISGSRPSAKTRMGPISVKLAMAVKRRRIAATRARISLGCTGLRTTSSTPQSKSASVFSSDGVSLMG